MTDMMWSSSVAYILQGANSEWGLTSIELGILGACFPFGLMLGAFVWGIIADRYGRMYSFKNTVLLATVSSAFLAFSVNFYMACIALVLIGAGMGGEIFLGGTVFCEFCPPTKMFHLATMALFWALGGIYIALIALITVMENDSSIGDWRIIVGSGLVLEFFCLIFRYSMKETPAFLLITGNFIEAEKVLSHISMQNNGKSYQLDRATLLKQHELNMSLTASVSSHISIFIRFKENNKKKILLFAIVSFKQIYFTASFVFTAILYFMPMFLDNLSIVESYGIILLQQISSVPGIIFGSYLIETRLGRKFTIVLSFGLSSLCCFLFYIEQNLISVVIVTSFFYFLMELGYSALYTITPESYPTEIRNVATAFANICARLAGICAPLVTSWLLSQKNGLSIALALFAVVIAISAFTAILLTETKIRQNDDNLIKS